MLSLESTHNGQLSRREHEQDGINSNIMFLLGVGISIIGASLSVLGLMVQKLAHVKEEQDAKAKMYCLSLRWLFGLAVFIAGNVVSWVSLGMGPASVLSCFDSINIVLAMLLAPSWFGETVSRFAQASAATLIVGCVWVTITGPRSYQEHNVKSLSLYFHSVTFEIFCLVCVVLVLTGKYTHHTMTRPWSLSGIIQVVIMAAIFGSYAVLFSKCTSMVVNSGVTSSIGDQSNLGATLGDRVSHWQFFVWAGATVLLGACQIYFLNENLRHSFASFVIPFYESFGLALRVTMGGIFFQEYQEFTFRQHAAFWPGIFVVLLGLIGLASSAPVDEKAQAESLAAMKEEKEEERASQRRRSEADMAAGGGL